MKVIYKKITTITFVLNEQEAAFLKRLVETPKYPGITIEPDEEKEIRMDFRVALRKY